ncbi:MAG TPA: hypothetical protein VFU40_01205 [Gemmatimonadales bacterium]|nr:hypothetical protein [Gemmatimonadales bacterium]
MSKASEADIISREHLVRVLLEQIERTFATDGRDKALQHIAGMLRRLDETALRALVYEQGLVEESELIEAEEESGKAGSQEE